MTTIMAIQETPAADVAPMVHGEWKQESTFYIICSNCGAEMVPCPYVMWSKYTKMNYCPNCGARMDLKEGENDGTVD